jgi:hypothetical protein
MILNWSSESFPVIVFYHLTKTHCTDDCHVKKECNKLIASQRNQSTPSASQHSVSGSNTGNLHHITEEVFEDAVDHDDTKDDSSVHSHNDTNKSGLLYFAQVSKHYLHLVKNDSFLIESPRHLMKYLIIIDSGANFHVFWDCEFFTSMLPASGKVILGDGKTSLPILGMGNVQCLIGSQKLTIENVRCIPTLSESIYSLFLHVQLPIHGIHSSFDQGLFLQSPDFQTKAIIGRDDLYLDARPLSVQLLTNSSTPTLAPLGNVCCHIMDFQKELAQETDHLDNLLYSLRKYYNTIKTKRQLKMEMPAGFRQASNHQKLYHIHHYTSPSPDVDTTLLCPAGNIDDTTPDALATTFSSLTTSNTEDITDNINTELSSFTAPTLIIRLVDKPSLSTPNKVTVSEDFLRASMGFRRIDTVKKYMHELYSDTLSLFSTPADTVLDSGDLATLHKKARNTTSVPRPVIHMDIVFGPEISVGNVHYGLQFTDHYSRMNYIYP